MSSFKSKLYNFRDYLINKGIPFPLFQDQGVPSASFTLLMSSFIIWILGATEIIKDMDLDKTENLFMICCGLYFSRKLTKNKTEITTSIQGDVNNEETK